MSGNPYEVQEVEIRSLEPEDDEVPITGGKDPYTQGAHCEHIVRTDNM